MLDTYIKWLKAHERLLLVAVAGLALWFAIGKVDTLLVSHDKATVQQAQIIAQVQQEKNDALVAQMKKNDADKDALVAQVQARDAQLTQLQATLVTALANQQAKDKVLTPTDLTARLNTLVPTAGATVTPNGVLLPEQGAVATVVELEKAPVLAKQLAASNEELTNAEKLVAAEGQQVTDRDVLITGLQTKSVDDAKVCTAQIALVKAEARKSKRRWFLAGVVTGWFARQVVKTYTGL